MAQDNKNRISSSGKHYSDKEAWMKTKLGEARLQAKLPYPIDPEYEKYRMELPEEKKFAEEWRKQKATVSAQYDNEKTKPEKQQQTRTLQSKRKDPHANLSDVRHLRTKAAQLERTLKNKTVETDKGQQAHPEDATPTQTQ